MTTDPHTARQGIFNYLTGRAICPTPRPAEEAETLLDAFAAEERAVVLAEAAERQYEHLRRQGRGQDIVCEGCPECLPREYVELINAIDPTAARASEQRTAAVSAPVQPPADRAALAAQFGDVLRRWGLLDEVNDPTATAEFVVTDLLAVLPGPVDRAAVLREAADAVAADTDHIRYGSATDYADRHAVLLRRMADEEQPGTEARTVCVCGHTRGEHATVNGRLLCDVCVPDSTENLVCKEFEAL